MMQYLGKIYLLKGEIECLHSLPYVYSSGIRMNHDITDEVMLGVILVDVRVLEQRVFVTGKRSDQSTAICRYQKFVYVCCAFVIVCLLRL